MANCALALINAFSAQPTRGVLGQFDRPGHFIGVNVENSRVWVERRAAPLASAVEPGKNDGVLASTQRNELPFAAKGPELLENEIVRLRGSVGEHVLGQALPCIGSGFGGKRLGFGGNLSLQIAGRILAVFDREQGRSIRAIEY